MAGTIALRPSGYYLMDDVPVIGGVAVLCAVYAAGLAMLGIALPSPGQYVAYSQLYLWGLVLLVLGRGIAIVLRRPERPLLDFGRELAVRLPRIVAAAPVLLALIVFMALFGKVKAAIPAINPFAWDGAFVEWDLALFGTDPWRILQPVLGYPAVTATIGALYKLWLGLIFAGSWFFAAYIDDRRLRARYLISYFAIWFVIGSVLAIALSSVGPVFLEPIAGNAHFAEQTRYLAAAHAEVPNVAVTAQEYLLSTYHAGRPGLGAGISAMPSMHVALALLFWLAVRRQSRAAGRIFAVFLAIIAAGSVHLAYHYAVDGILAAAVTLAIWKLAGLVTDRLIRAREPDEGIVTDADEGMPAPVEV